MSLFSPYYIGTTLNLFSLLIVASSGAFFALKTRSINLGGEGQIYLGGFITAILLNAFTTLPAFFAILFSFLASMFFSGFLTLLSAILKKSKNTSFLLTSFILSKEVKYLLLLVIPKLKSGAYTILPSSVEITIPTDSGILCVVL